MSRRFLACGVVLALAACGSPANDPADGGAVADASPTTQPSPDEGACMTACMAEESGDLQRYCGSDRQTYNECQVMCATLPEELSFYQGACGADGMPEGEQPPYPADGESVCDWFKNGDQWTAVGCDEDSGGGGAGAEVSDTGSDPTPSASPAAPDTMVTQASVDHRARYGSVKNQGSAPTCIAFAGTAALEGAVYLVSGERLVLSEMHLFSRYTSLWYPEMARAAGSGIATNQQAEAAGLGYDPSLAVRWLCNNSRSGFTCPRGVQAVAPDMGVRTSLNSMALFAVTSVDRIQPEAGARAVTAEQLRDRLDDGQDLVVGFRMNDNWYPNHIMPGGIIRDYTAGRNFGHAVVLVGYTAMNGRSYFIIRNSWGTAWAQNGYGYISFETAQSALQVAYSVTARRLTDDLECDMGEAVALDGNCRRVCPDGSLADAEDVCHGVGATCPENTIADPSNICVRACAAAPVQGAGFTGTCNTRGCTYTINGGTNGCRLAAGRVCRQFCPAPNCGFTTAMNEFGQPVFSCIPTRE
ncbi:MAG: C1 family peptidase [Polyangiales bacterium]